MKTLLKSLSGVEYLTPMVLSILTYVCICLTFTGMCVFALALGFMSEETYATANKFGVTLPTIPMFLVFCACVVYDYRRIKKTTS